MDWWHRLFGPGYQLVEPGIDPLESVKPERQSGGGFAGNGGSGGGGCGQWAALGGMLIGLGVCVYFVVNFVANLSSGAGGLSLLPFGATATALATPMPLSIPPLPPTPTLSPTAASAPPVTLVVTGVVTQTVRVTVIVPMPMTVQVIVTTTPAAMETPRP